MVLVFLQSDVCDQMQWTYGRTRSVCTCDVITFFCMSRDEFFIFFENFVCEKNKFTRFNFDLDLKSRFRNWFIAFSYLPFLLNFYFILIFCSSLHAQTIHSTILGSQLKTFNYYYFSVNFLPHFKPTLACTHTHTRMEILKFPYQSID